jgi:general stress protein 26
MDEQEKKQRIKRARELLRDIHNIPVTTVNEDGSPHASPVFLVFDNQLHGFWASSPSSLHSQNIARDSRVFLVVFDSREGHGGLFLSGVAGALIDREAIIQGIKQLRVEKKKLEGGEIGDATNYMGDGLQRIYHFSPEHAWVNYSNKLGDVIVRDHRYEIAFSDLIIP